MSETEAEAILCDKARLVLDVKVISSQREGYLRRCANGEAYFSHGEEVIRISDRPA